MSLYQHGITLKALLENPDLLNPPKNNQEEKSAEKKKEGELADFELFNGQSAFLGPQLWDKTLYDDPDFKLEYMDLDEFLTENGINVDPDTQLLPNNGPKSPTSDGDLQNIQATASSPQSPECMTQLTTAPKAEKTVLPNCHMSPIRNSPVRQNSLSSVNYTVSPEEIQLATIPGEEEFDPKRREFTDEELRPQPIVKKSKKIFVADDQKDDKYWSRRKKNNIAAKRSRDARRIKENQISMRASFLEKENKELHAEVENVNSQLQKALAENEELRKRLGKYENGT